MTGTHAEFYLVPVTTVLSDVVITCQRPATQTELLRCPTEATPTPRASVGIEDMEYRKLALKRFLAFKELAQRHWALILEGVQVASPQLSRKRLARSNFCRSKKN